MKYNSKENANLPPVFMVTPSNGVWPHFMVQFDPLSKLAHVKSVRFWNNNQRVVQLKIHYTVHDFS